MPIKKNGAESLEVLVARIDERTKAIYDNMDKMVTKDEFQPVKERLSTFVERDEFNTVRNVVYGMVTLILVAFMGGVIVLVIPP